MALRAFLNFTLAKKRECFKDFNEGQREAFQIIPFYSTLPSQNNWLL